jgi:hypothetical protein
MPAAGSTPAYLLAPRFARVKNLRVPVPQEIVESGQACEVWIEGIAPGGWITHLRVAHDAAPFPITLACPHKTGAWSCYALTLPPHATHVEISKLPNAEAGLAALEFRPVELQPEVVPQQTSAPSVVAMFDTCVYLDGTLQPEADKPVFEFYAQTRAAGFTDLFLQVYAGSATWSETAPPLRNMPFGHRSYANTWEPSYLLMGDVAGLQRHLDAITERDLRAVASFRINNEWIAEWVKEWWAFTDGAPDHASVFSYQHPEFWMSYKDGTRYGSGLDFAFPEVREYRLSIIREWCDKFRNFDEICIDLYRHPPMVSYPEHLVQEFWQATGINVREVEPRAEDTLLPEWLKLRAAHFTQFMRAVRSELRSRYGDRVLLSARIANNVEQALLDGADLSVWLEEGLVDRYLLTHRPPQNPLEQDSSVLVRDMHQAGAKAIHFFEAPQSLLLEGDTPQNFQSLLEQWSAWGSDGFGFYEAERIVRDGRWLRKLPQLVARY